jgi:hypothetical protein
MHLEWAAARFSLRAYSERISVAIGNTHLD